MTVILVSLLVILMLIAAVFALLTPYQASAIVATSIVSLVLALLFVVMQAPDVAMTEAVVGSGLSGVILALVLYRLKASGDES